jgi:hypothetical protein
MWVCALQRIGLSISYAVEMDSPILSLTVHFQGCYNKGDHRLYPVGCPEGSRFLVLPREASSVIITTGHILQSGCSPVSTRFFFHVMPAMHPLARLRGGRCP